MKGEIQVGCYLLEKQLFQNIKTTANIKVDEVE